MVEGFFAPGQNPYRFIHGFESRRLGRLAGLEFERFGFWEARRSRDPLRHGRIPTHSFLA